MVDLNITLWIQLANFLVTLVVLNYLLISPIRKIIRKRKDNVEGLIGEIEAFTAEKQQLLDEYESELRKAREAAAIYRKDGKLIGIAAPQRRVYAKWGQMQFAEAAVIPSLGNEFYATLMAVDQQNRAVFRLSSNPLVNWLWIGGILMCLLPFVSFRRRNGREN